MVKVGNGPFATVTLSHGSSLAVLVFGRGFASERGFRG
jgi:hypothetical protein